MVRFFIDKGIVTVCLNLSILLIGFFSFDEIANEFIPAIEIPAVGVLFPTTFLQHDKVVHELIGPAENKLLSTGDVEKIETTLDQDRTLMFIFYKWSIPPEEALQRARQVVSSIKRPKGVLDPIFVLHRPTMSPILRIAFSGKNIHALTETLEPIAGKVERLPGVAQVNLVGASPEKGIIEVNPVQAAHQKVSIQGILSSAYETWSFRHVIPEDKKNGNSLQILRVKLADVKDLANSLVLSDAGKPVPARWISSVQKITNPPSVYMGQAEDAIILEVIKAPGSDAVAIVDQVQQMTHQLLLDRPDLKSTIVYNEAQKIKEAQSGVLLNFALGVALNSIILIIFLGSIIGAVVASCIFPTAILGTLYIMKVSDISLNIFALNGFSLASGMITDASIVVLESIMRRFQKGEELITSCDKGSRDVMLGVFASTLTTAAVIVPISIQSGVSSKLFSDLGIVLVATQFISLIAVFTFVPWLCSKILSEDSQRPKPIEYLFRGSSFLVNKMTSLSSHTLKRSIHDRKFRIGIPVAATAISVIALMFLPNSEFLPVVASKIYSFSVPVQRIELMNNGAQLQKQLARLLGPSEGIDWVVTSRDNNTLQATLKVQHQDVVAKLVTAISQELDIEESKILAIPIGPTPPTEPMSYDGHYYVREDLPAEMKEQIRQQFCQSPGILDCLSTQHYSEPTVVLRPEPIQMARGQTNIIETTINIAALTKNLDLASIANLPLSFPVELKINHPGVITSLPFLIGKEQNAITTLGSGFSEQYKTGSNVHFRRDGQAFEPIYFRISGITIGEAISKFNETAESLGLSSDKYIPMGTIESMNETFEKMTQALIIATMLIFLILVIQFKSIAQALIIMYSMPLALGGSVIGLLLMGETLNVGVMVGFILLAGIIVNNGILLMDAINQRVASGMQTLAAVLESVESRTRPILMTTFSTVFGMLPTLILEAEGKELYRGMAIVNIFGMLFGTALTLVVIPLVIRWIIALKEKPPLSERS